MYKLMVVDDSSIIRNKIARCFNNTNFELVANATNGVEALSMFKQYRPDAITMDLTMPQMDGIECIKRIVAEDSEVKILVVSALSDRKTGIQAIKCGARGVITKPFTELQLVDSLNEMMSSSM